MNPKILGIDPGFAALGLALVELQSMGEIVHWVKVVRTEKSALKREVRASDDNLLRIGVITSEIEAYFTPDVCAIAAESQSWPRNAGASTKVGMAWGVIGALATLRGIPVLQVSPQELKKRLTGSKSASKEEVQAALVRRYGEVSWPKQKAQVEHASDALAAVVACLDHSTIQLARRMLGSCCRRT